MKRVLQYLIIFIIVFFVLPAVLTTRKTRTVFSENTVVENSNSNTENGQNNESTKEESSQTIKLLHTATNEVEEIPLEEYIVNVVSSEMPADYEEEALKAQAIVARTYTMYKMKNRKHEQADICDSSTCCQAWISKEKRFSKWEEGKREENWNKISKCVNDTKGKIITYNNEPINAFFHANSGGSTELPKEVWGGENYPYLQVVQTAGEEGYKQYNSEASYTYEELKNKLQEKYKDIAIDFNNTEDVKILEHTESGRVKTIKFGNHELSGVETRTIFGLKSANFEISNSDGKISFNVKGYGHGVGMSQTGADTLAKEGKNAEEIIHHFYSNVEISDI